MKILSLILKMQHVYSLKGVQVAGRPHLFISLAKIGLRGSPQLNLANIKLLLLVHLRGFFNNHSITLRDIVQLYYTEEAMVDVVTCKKPMKAMVRDFVLYSMD